MLREKERERVKRIDWGREVRAREEEREGGESVCVCVLCVFGKGGRREGGRRERRGGVSVCVVRECVVQDCMCCEKVCVCCKGDRVDVCVVRVCVLCERVCML